MDRTTLLDVSPFVLVVADIEFVVFGQHAELQRSDSCAGLYMYFYGPIRCVQDRDQFDAHFVAYYRYDGCHTLYLVRLPQPT